MLRQLLLALALLALAVALGGLVEEWRWDRLWLGAVLGVLFGVLFLYALRATEARR